MADLPSILGGMAQGFLDFGKSAVDLFGTGGASIADLIESARTGKVTTKNSDDFRKWLYDTNDVKDAAAKGLGTALNGVQTVSDYIPGIGAVTRNPLFNAGQGALGGLADEFKMYGKDYDLGRAGQRAAVGAGGALASTGLADALKGSGNALLKSGTAQGLARGAVGGAIGAGGYTAIDGGSLGDVANSALQGAGMGAALGGTMGALQDFKPARNYDMALTDEEKAARIANAKNMLANEQDPERIAELNNQINSLGGGPDGARNYRTFATGDEAREYFSKSNPAYWDGLPSSVDEGIQEYTRNGYSRVNDMLRTGQDNYGYPDTDVLIGDIERGIEGYNLPDDIKVYRRSAADAYKNLGVGDTFTDEGFTSTSVSPNIGGDFGKANIEINVGNGKGVGAFIGDLSSGNGDEGEFLLQRGTKYKVLGRGKDGTLQLEVVGNERRPLEQILSASDAAVNSPRYLTDENGNPRTFYHGSPNANITEFDINQAGKNTMSGEHALFFTDDLGTADNFAHEQIPTESMFFVEKGKRGKVYPVNLEMNNPLDLDNLTDAQIEELWPYASYMGSWQGKDHFVKQLTDWRDKYHNAQQTKGYLDLDKLRDSQYDGIIARMYPNQDNQAREYAVFDNSKIKMLDDLQAVNDANIMASRILPDELDLGRTLAGQDMTVNSAKIAPGQLGLFDDMPTQTPKTGTRQTSLFDQPQEGLDYYGEDIEAPVTTPTNPYAPVDGQVTQAMRDRAADILGNWKKNGVPENELYNAIDPETLPAAIKGAKSLDVDNLKNVTKNIFGVDDIKKADINKVIAYAYSDSPKLANYYSSYIKSEPPKSGIYKRIQKEAYEAANARMMDEMTKQLLDSSVIDSSNLRELKQYSPADHATRSGYTAAADEVLSERLGIAPGNTPKYNGRQDVRNAYGRYNHPVLSAGGDLAIFERKMSSPEDAVSTMAHERLHSFQGEAESRNKARYNQEVIDAYNDLHNELKNHYKDWDDTAKRYGSEGTVYWQNTGEQEARMLQTYLENKGYAQAEQMQNKYRKGEWGSEINPAFDKFFDKLRDLSKRGVALPALTALFGGGALMANQQKDKEEVR